MIGVMKFRVQNLYLWDWLPPIMPPRSRPLVPPMPIGLGSLPLVEPFPALTRVVVPSFCLSRFHLPASLDSTGVTPLLRYYGGSVTSRAQFFGPSNDHERCSFPGS